MKRTIQISAILCLAVCLLLTGCNFPGFKGEATKTPNAAEAVVQTAMANAVLGLTQTALASSSQPLPTMAPAKTEATAPIVIPTMGNTQPPVVVPSGTDNAALVSETIPDNTKILPGASFTKSWRIMNTGTSTWTTDYKLVFSEGEQMGAANEYRMPMTVDAGKIIELAVPMKAPTTLGTYQGYWKIKNSSGQTFGTNKTGSFWVKIVVAAATPTITLSPTATTIPPTVTTAPATATPTLTPEGAAE